MAFNDPFIRTKLFFEDNVRSYAFFKEVISNYADGEFCFINLDDIGSYAFFIGLFSLLYDLKKP